jgi:hypothetical protein
MKTFLLSLFLLLTSVSFSQTFLFKISEVRNLIKSGNNALYEVLENHDEPDGSYFVDIRYTFNLDSGLVFLESFPFNLNTKKIFKINKLTIGNNIYELSITDNFGGTDLSVELQVVIDVDMTSLFIRYYDYVNNLTVVIDPRQYSFDEIKKPLR